MRTTVICSALVLAAGLSLAACSKKQSSGGAAGSSAGAGSAAQATNKGGSGAGSGGAKASGAATASAADLEVVVPAGFSGFGMEKLLARLQGAWLVRGATLARAHAWNVRGRSVAVYDGAREKRFELSVLSPCAIKLSRQLGGGTTSTITVVAFDGDTLYAGLGGAAIAGTDGAWVACLGGQTFTLRAGKCALWKRSMFRDELKIVPGECSVADKGGSKVFRAKVRGSQRELAIEGKVAMTAQKRRAPAERADSYQTAKMKAAGLSR
ncbi:MAG: hypothetical protein KC503_08460 [Myxococcales bacterium]|nr:hypothetical protein [Myxococcales bacterium]